MRDCKVTAAICASWIDSAKYGRWPGSQIKGLPEATICPKDRTKEQSSIMLKQASPNLLPTNVIAVLLVKNPFPVSNLIGSTLVECCSIIMLLNPCCINARFDHRSLPAPLSAIHPISWWLALEDCANMGGWFDRIAGAQWKESLTPICYLFRAGCREGKPLLVQPQQMPLALLLVWV